MVTFDNYKEVAEAIDNKVSQMICLTEDCTPEEFVTIRASINESLNRLLPEKSSYEK